MNIKFIISHQYLSVIGDKLPKDFYEWLDTLEYAWSIHGPTITEAIEEVTGLTFKSKTKPCYVNNKFSISDPLSLRLTGVGKDDFDNLTHELIHVILTENYPTIQSKWQAYMDSLGEEELVVKSHVMVHSIHAEVAKKLKLNTARLKRIETYSKHPAYKKSWRIAKKRGYKEVVGMLK